MKNTRQDSSTGLLIRSKADLTEAELQEANKILSASPFPATHSFETHNFCIKRTGRCIYCDLGSKSVPKALMDKR